MENNNEVTAKLFGADVVRLSDISVGDRARKDLGDIPAMVASIREFGIIQPIVLARPPVETNGEGKPSLVVGGRRLAALQKLGFIELRHGVEFVWRDEQDELRLKSIELEENLKRKDMEWHEVVAAKQALLETMQRIHGASRGAGAPSLREQAAGETSGFGVRKLAAMLGESPALVSKDLHLAQLVQAMPALRAQESKSAAARIGTINLALHHIKAQQAAKAATEPEMPVGEASPLPRYDLFQGDWKQSIHTIEDEEVDLIYTDLPYWVDLDKQGATANVSAHGGAITYSDSRDSIVGDLEALCQESYRVLKPHRFGVYFFGFNYYYELLCALNKAGFTVNPIPVVWLKHQQFTQLPLKRYGSAYEQALVAMKGSPSFVRPGQPNVVDVPGLRNDRLQVAQQPVPLVERFILDMTLPRSGAKILDFYAGTGTTGVAALQLGQYPILFERMPEQCLLIRQRLEQSLKAQQPSASPTKSVSSVGSPQG